MLFARLLVTLNFKLGKLQINLHFRSLIRTFAKYEFSIDFKIQTDR